MLGQLSSVLCVTLILMSCLFILIELRTRFHTSFLSFAASIIVLSSFSAFDLWYKSTLFQDSFLLNLQHAIFCFFPPVLLIHIMSLTKKEWLEWSPFAFLPAVMVAGLFLAGTMLRTESDGVRPTVLYAVLFLPYLVLYATPMAVLLVRGTFVSRGRHRSLLGLHIFACVLLGLSAVPDTISLYTNRYIIGEGIGFNALGGVLFGLILILAFSERLAQLVNDNKAMLAKLNNAYRDLETARAISDKGKSTAILNHETRLHLFTVMSTIEKTLAEPISNHARELVVSMKEEVDKLFRLNHDILDVTKKTIMSRGERFDLVRTIQTLLHERFPAQRDLFKLSYSETPYIMYGDRARFNDALAGIFSLLQARRTAGITVECRKQENTMLLQIDCSGAFDGMDFAIDTLSAERLQEHNPTFELSIVRAALEANGAHISTVDLQTIDKDTRGVRIYITVPNYDDDTHVYEKPKDNIVLVKEGLENVEHILKVFHDTFVHPHVVGRISEVFEKFDNLHFIFGDISVMRNVPPHLCVDYDLLSLASEGPGKLKVAHVRSRKDLGYFSEHFILHYLFDYLRL